MGEPGRPRLLAVDDEELARRTYARLLNKYGDPVVVATAAQAKMELAAWKSWGAFCIDLRLTDGSGLELLEHARKDHPATPALLMTGHVKGWVVNEAFDLGAETLSKPFDPLRFHHWMERSLGLLRPTPIESLRPVLLLKQVETLRKLLVPRKPADARVRYRIGAIVAELKARPDRYGERAVPLAAAALGEDQASLYRHARVAERWTPAEFEGLLGRTMAGGGAPSWSHLVLLATVEPKEARDRFFERMLLENWTVRQLDEALTLAEVGEDLYAAR